MTTTKKKPAPGAGAPATKRTEPRRTGPDPLKVAVYARSSGTGRGRRDAERQIEEARCHAEGTGASVVSTFVDRTRPGVSHTDRTGLGRLLAAARSGSFGVVLVESVDRIARGHDAIVAVHDHLQGLGIALHVVGRGPVDRTGITVMGMMVAEAARLRSAWRRTR